MAYSFPTNIFLPLRNGAKAIFLGKTLPTPAQTTGNLTARRHPTGHIEHATE